MPPVFVLFEQVAEQAAKLHYYIEQAVVEEVPVTTSIVDFMHRLDGDDSASLLSQVAADFLDSGHQTLVLLGDAGAGKSTFCWKLGQRLLGDDDLDITRTLETPAFRRGVGSSVVLPWIPVVMELKTYKASELHGLLPRLLAERLRVPQEAVGALLLQASSSPAVRLLVICDGYDELVMDETVRSLTLALCGGEDQCWPASILKVVATSRPNRLNGRLEEGVVFGPHQRRQLLPFTKARVSFFYT